MFNLFIRFRMRYFLMFLCFLGFSYAYSQEKLINGRIIIDIDEESAEGIYVTNKRTQITTITDLTGSFGIRVQEGDELLIRSYLYESRKFILTKHFIEKGFVTIHLNLQPIVLGEAIITQKLTGYLEKDVKYQSSKDVVAKLYKSLGINPDADKLRDTAALKPWKDYSPFSLNVESVLEAITGDLRRRRNLYDFEGREERIENIRNYFGDNYFVTDLKIPKEKIRDFLYYSFETTEIPNYYVNSNYLSIMVELNKTSKFYLNRLDSWYKTNDKTLIEN